MDKFSKIRPKSEFSEDKDEIIYDGDNFKVIKFEDWTILKERDMVICVPYFIELNQFLLRYEYIPTYKYIEGNEHYLTVLSGSIERGEDVLDALKRELEEEAGIVLRDDYKIEDEIKPMFVSKGVASKYYPFILPLNERDYHEVVARGDGSKSEAKSKSVKINVKYIDHLNFSDVITGYMILRLKQFINTFDVIF